jgi:hypothetical protein
MNSKVIFYFLVTIAQDGEFEEKIETTECEAWFEFFFFCNIPFNGMFRIIFA